MAASSRHSASACSARGRGVNQLGKQGRYQRHELAAAAGWAVLVVVIAVLSAWAHHSLSTSRPAVTKTAAVRPAGAASAAPLASPPSPPLRVQLRAWLDDAEASIDALVVAGDNVVATATRGDTAGTGTACQTAAGALASARQHLPSPDPALNTALQQAFSDYRAGIRCCFPGTQNQDAVDVGQAPGLIDQGKIVLQNAFDILEADLSADSDVLTA
jgi:hypothetical protein